MQRNTNDLTIEMQVKSKKNPNAYPIGEPADTARPKVDSVERTLSQVGDAWTFLILREAFFGARRFDDFSKALDAAPNILTSRLKKLVEHGLFERVQYGSHSRRFEYRLTRKGLDLYPAIVMLMSWGDRWLDEGKGAPLELIHTPCAQVLNTSLVCEHCHTPIQAHNVSWRVGPGGHD